MILAWTLERWRGCYSVLHLGIGQLKIQGARTSQISVWFQRGWPKFPAWAWRSFVNGWTCQPPGQLAAVSCSLSLSSGWSPPAQWQLQGSAHLLGFQHVLPQPLPISPASEAPASLHCPLRIIIPLPRSSPPPLLPLLSAALQHPLHLSQPSESESRWQHL